MLANAPSADNPHLPFCPPEHLMLGGTATRRPVNGYTYYMDGTLKARPLPQLELELSPQFTYTAGEPRYFWV